MTLFVLVLGFLAALGPLSIDTYLPALPLIERSLGTDASSVQLSLASFFLGLSVGQLLHGPVSDRFGRKPPLVAGLIAYTVASVGCAFASDVGVLIALRFVQAFGGCAGMVVSRAMVRDTFARDEAAKVFSRLMLIMGVAPILAPLLGGFLGEAFGWQAIFGFLGVFGAAATTAAGFLLPETLARPEGQSPVPLSLRGVMRGYARVLADRSFTGPALSGGIAQAGMFAYITGSAFVFIDHFGLTPRAYAWIFGANAGALILASQVNARLLGRLGSRKILSRALMMLVVTSCTLAAAALAGAGMWAIMVPLFLFVATLGFTFPNSSALALSEQGARAGSASALIGTVQFTIAFACSSLVSALHDGTPVPMATVMAGCGLLAFGLFRWLTPRGA